MEEKSKYRFCVVGNIVGKHIDDDGNEYYGTKAFTTGTKVYLEGIAWYDGIKEISVIGRNRFGRMVIDYVPIKLIENIRAQRVYKPQVLEIMHHLEVMDGWIWRGSTVQDRREADDFVRAWRNNKSLIS